MRSYFIKIGEKELGPFVTAEAAKAEAKALKKKGYDLSVKQRTIADTALFEALGNPETELDLDEDQELDLGDDKGGTDDDDVSGLFDDDDDDDDDEGDDDKGKDKDDDDDEDKAPGEGDDDDDDDAPTGVHPWFKSFGKGN